MTPEQIARRASAVRLSRNRLAELAKLDKTTVGRTLNGLTRPLQETVTKMEGGLVADELALLRHLLALHGVPADLRSAA